MSEETPWHSLVLGDVFDALSVKENGLSTLEAERRRKKFGPNEITEKKGRSRLSLFVAQCTHPLVLLLIVSGIISLFFSAWLDSAVVFIVAMLNASIGFWQEYKAQKALHSLHTSQTHMSFVLRDRRWQRVETMNLVPGDRIKLRAGDRLGADARLISSLDISMNESLLTGESEPVPKNTTVITENVPVSERSNVVWSGSSVYSGKGEALVVATGDRTQFGHIGILTQRTRETMTPFETRVLRLGRFLGVAIVALVLLLFALGLLTGRPMEEMFLLSVAITVSAIPEGLPVALTVILSVGMLQILKRGGLVKTLSAAQALGSTSVILTDKTGTLTEGVMRLTKVLALSKKGGILELVEDDTRSEEVQLRALRMAALTADVTVENPSDQIEMWRMHGNATDQAFVVGAELAGLEPVFIRERFTLKGELPFSPERKFACVVREMENGQRHLFVTGAPEVVMRLSSQAEVGGRVVPLGKDDRNEIRSHVSRLAREGLRVIAVASKAVDEKDLPPAHNTALWGTFVEGLTFVAVLSLKDPVRGDAAEMLREAKEAGINTVIVTGDHGQTAIAVGKEVGLLSKGKNLFTVLEGSELALMSEEELSRRVRSYEIFSRVTPEQKLRITKAWQAHGHVVATIGDGINDAPALKLADVGVAVGTGADLAKEAADIVLLKNSFTTIVAAIREGRVIIDNLKKVLTYMLSDSFTEFVLLSVAILAGLPLPFLPAQILWAKVVADVGPGIALAFEKPEKDVMKMPPVSQKSSVIDKEMRFIIILVGLATDTILLGLFLFFLGTELMIENIRTIMFAALCIETLFYAFSMRSLRRPLWQINFWSNRYLLLTVGAGVALTVLAIYLPPLTTLLRTTPLTGLEWIIIVGFGIVNVIAIELAKWLWWRKRTAQN